MNIYPTNDHDELARQLIAANRQGTLADFCGTHGEDFTIQTLEALGRIMNQWRLKDANSTMELARIGNEVAVKIGADTAFGFADWLQGAAFSYVNQHILALEHFERARSLLENQIELRKYLSLLVSLVGAYVFLGKSSKAIEVCTQVEALVDQSSNAHLLLLAYAVQNLGVLFQKQGRLTDATIRFKLAKGIYERLDRRHELAGVLSNLSNVLRETGDLSSSEEAVRKAICIFEQLGLEQEVSRSKLSLSSVLMKTGQFHAAQRELLDARSVFSKLAQDAEVATVDLYRAVIYSYLFMNEDALFLAQAARKHFQSAGLHWYFAYATLVIGLSLKALNKKQAALAELNVALEEFTQLNVEHLMELTRFAVVDCETSILNSDLKSSLSFAKSLSQPQYLSSFQIQQSLLIAETAVNQGLVSEAEAIVELLTPLATNDLERELRLLLLFVIGKVHQSKGELQLANKYFELACQEIATISEHLLTDEFKLSFAHGLNRVNQEWINTTYHFFQNSGGEIAPTLVAINLTNLTTSNTLGWYTSESLSMLFERSALRQQWIQLRLEQDPLFSVLEGQAPESGHRENNRHLLHLEKQLLDVSRLVPLGFNIQNISSEPRMDDYHAYFDNLTIDHQGIAQVQFFQANEKIHAVVFDSGGKSVKHCLAPLAFLSRLLKAWRMVIRGRGVTENRSAQKTMLATFYEKLIRPLELENINELFFATPPELHDLPLHACHDGKSYLVQKTTISYINFPYSIDDNCVPKSFNLLNKRPSALLGSYSMQHKLPHTKDECLKVANLLRKQEVEVCCFPETLTSKELEIEGKYADIIHLSAHGDYRKDNSIFSSIHLSDGPLSALQVSTMAFENRPLLVLNACSTSSGSKRAGALQGIVRSFLMSGAGYVVANQWEIEDAIASIFMQEFYEHLAVDTLNPGKTLQETQCKLINQGASINEWGSYVCWQNHHRGKGERYAQEN